jgi:hypothetical protein
MSQETVKPQYLILGRKWWDSLNGNTYHSVKVVDLGSGETLIKRRKTYGYGGMYVQTAYEGLTELGLVVKEDRFNHELNRSRFIIECVDVKNEEDLEDYY